MSKLSVIIPVYNGEKYIENCINMALKQTFKEFELILINDGSKDNSLNIMRKYAVLDSRIKIIDKKNSGVSDTRNLGIDVVRSPYLMFIDCDDLYDSKWFDVMYNTIQKEDTDLVICGHTDLFMYRNSCIEEIKVLIESKKIACQKDFFNHIIDLRKKGVGDVLWNKIYKTSIIRDNNIRFKNLRLGEDVVFNMDYYGNIRSCFLLNESHYKYCIEIDNLKWNKYSKHYYKSVEQEYILVKKKLEEFSIFNEYAKEFQANHLIYGYIDQLKNFLKEKKNNKEIIFEMKEITLSTVYQEALEYCNFNSRIYTLLMFFLKRNMLLMFLYILRVYLVMSHFKKLPKLLMFQFKWRFRIKKISLK